MSGFVEVPLTQGKVALIDAVDAEAVLAHKWSAHQTENGRVWYASRSIRRGEKWTSQQMHTFLTGYLLTDHRNGDGLDNRRSNLRPATKVENARNRPAQANNTSGFKGVNWDKQTGKWRAKIKVDGGHICLGRYLSPERAAQAYDEAAREHFGEFARLNFPDGEVVPIA